LLSLNKKIPAKEMYNPVKEIREMCIECMRGRGSGQNYSKLIEECGSPCCPAFAFRFGTNPHKKTKTLTREHKQALLKGSFLLVGLYKGGIMKGYLFGLGPMSVGEVKSG